MKISEKERLDFQRDGFLIVGKIVDNDRVRHLSAAMDRVYKGTYNRDIRPLNIRKPIMPFGTKESVKWILNARLVDDALWAMATDPILGEVAADLLGTSSVSIIEDQLLDKPGSSVPVNLHQDYSYWRFSTSVNMLTCWLALSDMSIDMGPVEMARGSHRWGFASRPRELIHGSAEEYLSAAQSVMPQGGCFDFAPVIVPSGGGAFFHSLTFHGSRGNTTDRVRRAISLHWAANDCRLDRSKLVDYDHPYLFTGVRHGERLANKYVPQVYPASTAT
jgi:ectoine hydroxylase-related dioxygenase (phytanoyl-CoA dioxygenase family)